MYPFLNVTCKEHLGGENILQKKKNLPLIVMLDRF